MRYPRPMKALRLVNCNPKSRYSGYEEQEPHARCADIGGSNWYATIQYMTPFLSGPGRPKPGASAKYLVTAPHKFYGPSIYSHFYFPVYVLRGNPSRCKVAYVVYSILQH